MLRQPQRRTIVATFPRSPQADMTSGYRQPTVIFLSITGRLRSARPGDAGAGRTASAQSDGDQRPAALMAAVLSAGVRMAAVRSAAALTSGSRVHDDRPGRSRAGGAS